MPPVAARVACGTAGEAKLLSAGRVQRSLRTALHQAVLQSDKKLNDLEGGDRQIATDVMFQRAAGMA